MTFQIIDIIDYQKKNRSSDLMLLQYDGLDAIGDLDEDYIDVNANSEHVVQDEDTGELPFDQWLEADILAVDLRVSFTHEEQISYNRHLTPVSTTTDTTCVDYEEQDHGQEAECVVGYDEKLHYVAVYLACMYKERCVKWLKHAKECRPIHTRHPLGCPCPWHTT